jgi:methionyl-tRNA formyltransferase
VRIVFAGTPEVALPSLDAFVASSHEVLAVLTRPDKPAGRGQRQHASPVATRAADLGIEVLRPDRPRDADFQSRLSELSPDCCPVVAYGALLPSSALDIPRYGWVNLHFSLLPAWRGAAPVQRSLLAGDTVTGATTFRIVPELDAGPIYASVPEPIAPTDTSGDLLTRLADRGARLLVETLDGIADGSLTPIPQAGDGISLAPKITVADAEIDWQAPAAQIDRLIRGCAPHPGAWTTFRGDRFKINSAVPLGDDALAPGRLAVDKRAVHVGTGTGALALNEVQAQGKKPMRAADWARGIRFGADESLGS